MSIDSAPQAWADHFVDEKQALAQLPSGNAAIELIANSASQSDFSVPEYFLRTKSAISPVHTPLLCYQKKSMQHVVAPLQGKPQARVELVP
jgi:hypothetical protein